MKVFAWLSKQWHWVHQPTLARRSAITVLASFTIIWAVLLAYQYYKVTSVQSTGQGMRNYGEAMLVAVNQFAQADQAAEHLRATEQFMNTRRKQIGILPGELTYELQTLQGQIAYQSKALPPAGVVAKQGAMTMLEHQGRQYAVYQGRSDK
jgi:two-component system, OmpR family, sensor histidine kinase QseC